MDGKAKSQAMGSAGMYGVSLALPAPNILDEACQAGSILLYGVEYRPVEDFTSPNSSYGSRFCLPMATNVSFVDYS
jgi:hypothetical protein